MLQTRQKIKPKTRDFKRNVVGLASQSRRAFKAEGAGERVGEAECACQNQTAAAPNSECAHTTFWLRAEGSGLDPIRVRTFIITRRHI